MKMIKTLAAVTAAALMSASAFAADGLGDELYNATAGAVNNDSAYMLDVIDWSKMDFAQAYGLVSLSSEKTGNLGVAYKLKNGATVHGYWNGNLWEENAYNTFAGLYGKDNWAIAGSFSKVNATISAGGISSSCNLKTLSGEFGMHLNDKMAFSAGLGYSWADFNGTDLTIFLFEGNFEYSLDGASGSSSSSKGRARGKAKTEEPKAAAKTGSSKESKAGISVDFSNTSISDADFSGTLFTLEPYYELQLPFASTAKYGFKVNAPLTFLGGDFDSGDNYLEIILKNGITAQVKPTVTFAAGLETTLPTVYFGDTDNGSFSNSFYMGCGIAVTSNVMLDVSANIKPTTDDDSGSNGESLDEVWKQTFAISCTVKM